MNALMNYDAYKAAREILVSRGWNVDGLNAVIRTHNGQASFGLDGTVIVFFRRHESGYGLRNLELGCVDEHAEPTEMANQVSSLVAAY